MQRDGERGRAARNVFKLATLATLGGALDCRLYQFRNARRKHMFILRFFSRFSSFS